MERGLRLLRAWYFGNRDEGERSPASRTRCTRRGPPGTSQHVIVLAFAGHDTSGAATRMLSAELDQHLESEAAITSDSGGPGNHRNG
jgi:hypothetical protein